MDLPFWSDQDRPFVVWALGITVNFKFIARRLGLAKAAASVPKTEAVKESIPTRKSREDRLRRQIEASKYEGKR
jgi:hypothetical protein